jgi:O-antigen/teichoic acid export membrane protein
MISKNVDKYISTVLKVGMILGLVGIIIAFLTAFVFDNWQNIWLVRKLLGICLISGITGVFGLWIYSKFDKYRPT